MKTYDLAIIGSGPGGYVAGLYASRHKLRTCVIEETSVGGTCLNRGCIPAKSLINAASAYSAVKSAGTFGINVDGCRIDFAAMLKRKEDTVLRLRTGIETLFRANKIDLVRGRGRLSGVDTIRIGGADPVKASAIIIATGSRAATPANLNVDERSILSSDGILSLRQVPPSLTVIGGGAIGCEFASLYNELGSKVAIVELTDRLLPAFSREASNKIGQIFRKRGIDVRTSVKVERSTIEGAVKLTLSDGTSILADIALVSTGREPAIDGLGLAELGIGTHLGRIKVDEHLRTAAANIYAIGDCVAGPQLAHKASYDAILACDNILGKARAVDYSTIPNCVWTDPEVASVGLSEEDARAAHPDAKVATFPYLASGKAYIEGKPEGYAKIVGTAAGAILGVEILGAGACELINEAALAKASRVSIADWSRVVHAHPTLSEIVQEAARVFCGTPIHSI